MHHPRRLTQLLVPLILLGLLTLPATAAAASETWDPATGALVVTTDAGDTGAWVARGLDGEPNSIVVCTRPDASADTCPARTGVRSISVTFTQPGQGFSVDDDALLTLPDGSTTHITLTGIRRSDLTYNCSPPKTTQHPCTITAIGSSLDTNHDSQPDVVFTNTTLSVLHITTGDESDLVDLRQLTVPFAHADLYETDTDMNAGNDRYYGTNKRDTVSLGPGHDRAFLYAGNDSGGGGIDTNWIDAGPGNDTLFGTKNSSDTFYGGIGNDDMLLHDGSDKAWGGPGNDRIDHRKGAFWVNLGPGNDQAGHYLGMFTGYGGPGNDFFNINHTGFTGLHAKIDCGTGYDETVAAFHGRKSCEKVSFPNAIIGE